MIIRVNWTFAPKRRCCQLAATVGNDLVHFHVELRATAGHPDVQREHVLMPALKDFVADLDDQFVALSVQPLAVFVRIGRTFLQDRVGMNHLPRNQVCADTEVLERALSLRAPKLVSRNFHLAETVKFFAGGYDG